MNAVTAVPVSSGSAAQTTPPSPKLAKAAREFESILLGQWLEKMQQTFSGSDESKEPGHDTMASLGTQAVATALAARGGIGIGSMLLRQLKASPAGSQDHVSVPAVVGSGLKKEVTGSD